MSGARIARGAILSAGAFAAVAAAAGSAFAARPVLAGEVTYGMAGGGVLVHYATSGGDAVPARDDDMDGVPDFVAEVAQTADGALTRFVQMGFRRPLADGVEGGDGRIDFYLRNLQNADGNAGTDSCSGGTCVGFAISENDFAGFSYATVTEGIRSVVPHELFHLVQYAYSSAQPGAWSEGSAVWSVEELYGDGNSDFERFLPSFLTRSFRPLERSGGGFGDNYPYGAALWAYFLSHRFDAALIVEAWAASSATAPFLDAIEVALKRRGSSLDEAFTEMTRWNLFTGPRAAGGRYAGAGSWPEVPKEPALAGAGKIYIEGLSARYVDVTVSGERRQLLVAPTDGIEVRGWAVAAGGGLADGVALAKVAGGVAATLEPGTYTLVVTGLSRNTITTAVNVQLQPAPVEPPDDDDDDGGDGGGCQATSATPAGAGPLGWIALALLAGGRRRAHRAHRMHRTPGR